MGSRRTETCAYCGAPLHLVAGFCAECLAPAPVAQQAQLVADGRRRAGLHLVGSSLCSHLNLPTSDARAWGLREDPPPRWPASLALVGVAALIVAIAIITLRVVTTTPPGFTPFATATLAAHLHEGGPAIHEAQRGDAVLLTYGIVADGTPVDIALTITPTNASSRTMRERWPGDMTLRQLTIAPLVSGNWHIILARNAQIVQTLDLLILPATS